MTPHEVREYFEQHIRAKQVSIEPLSWSGNEVFYDYYQIKGYGEIWVLQVITHEFHYFLKDLIESFSEVLVTTTGFDVLDFAVIHSEEDESIIKFYIAKRK